MSEIRLDISKIGRVFFAASCGKSDGLFIRTTRPKISASNKVASIVNDNRISQGLDVSLRHLTRDKKSYQSAT